MLAAFVAAWWLTRLRPPIPPLPVDEDKCKASIEKFACDSCINISKFDSQEKIGAELKKLSPEGFDLFWVSSKGR